MCLSFEFNEAFVFPPVVFSGLILPIVFLERCPDFSFRGG